MQLQHNKDRKDVDALPNEVGVRSQSQQESRSVMYMRLGYCKNVYAILYRNLQGLQPAADTRIYTYAARETVVELGLPGHAFPALTDPLRNINNKVISL